jgi:hypothetical protein
VAAPGPPEATSCLAVPNRGDPWSIPAAPRRPPLFLLPHFPLLTRSLALFPARARTLAAMAAVRSRRSAHPRAPLVCPAGPPRRPLPLRRSNRAEEPRIAADDLVFPADAKLRHRPIHRRPARPDPAYPASILGVSLRVLPLPFIPSEACSAAGVGRPAHLCVLPVGMRKGCPTRGQRGLCLLGQLGR